MAELGLWQNAVIALAVAFGALVQGSVGFGFALVSTGVISLVAPEAVPGILLLLALPINSLMILRERAAAELSGIGPLLGGLMVGTLGGVLVLRAVSGDLLAAAFGAAVLVAAAISAVHPGIEPRAGAAAAAGAVSGLITTVAGTGGPAIALLYQRRPGPQIRATLAVAFLVSALLSATGVAVAGRLGWLHLRLALLVSPAALAGFLASSAAARALDRRWLRPAVLSFSAASGVGAIVKALL